VALDPQLLDILACPDTHHAPLEYDARAQTLTCTECGRIFEVRDDIPILLLDEALDAKAEDPKAQESKAPETTAQDPKTEATP
jgi:uncharacterized protein YbaR (Trm112 family)